MFWAGVATSGRGRRGSVGRDVQRVLPDHGEDDCGADHVGRAEAAQHHRAVCFATVR